MDELDASAEAEKFLSRLHVITITYRDDDDRNPEVDLGDSNPWFAATLFKQIQEALDCCIPYPTISYQGNVIFKTVSGDIED